MTKFYTSFGSAVASLFVAGALMASTVPNLISAAPVTTPRDMSMFKREVWSPPITSPTAGDILQVGQSFTVTWDTSAEPDQVTSYEGTLLLGHMNSSGSNENLDTKYPLATGFDLRDGSHTIVVPDVPPLESYIIVLVGDSGNASPEFTIVHNSTTKPADAMEYDETK
ncbi:uncharacterized protein STEHIDRAFT_161793 [Stereum hirsutum FP-91666 SS1]|uniref:uncharacterized protein n=1 Tax=Stereum hirsutum (strain FP-91666) TaxID=721885 RepID=UPI00044492BA|nr:uncharacterized protein STEHIDRAFT_161793 [Stereum hirsutum FP-91666 SS1]EIM81617.1 hypothetical protein STEHIDRAFT_161793 [Stereum hirsutum FP-91666 SS1]